MTHVPGSRRVIDDLRLNFHHPLQSLNHLVQRYPFSTTDIEDFTCCVLSTHRKEVRLNHAIHVCEIPRLFSVTVNDNRSPGSQPMDKLWNHGGVLRMRVLTRTKHIEIPEANGLQAKKLIIELAVMFSHKFLQGIWGERMRRHFFRLWEDLGVSISRR